MFLHDRDYSPYITADDLVRVATNIGMPLDSTIKAEAQLAAVSEAQSYLRAGYDVVACFPDVYTYASTDTHEYAIGTLFYFPSIAAVTTPEPVAAWTGGYYTNLVAFTPTGNTHPRENPDLFASGDTRDPQLKMYTVDMTLYHLHSRIAPRQMSEVRARRYDAAKMWLKAVSRGDLSANLPLVARAEDGTPDGLQRFSFGSETPFNYDV